MANYTSTHTGATIDASVTIVSSSGVTQSDLTKLNAVTSSAVELNLLDGVTASTAEINILDGLTATTAELNYLDGADSSITTLSLPDNTTITTFGASLIDDADAASARTTLGVDVAGTDNSTDVTLVTTSHDYLSISGQAITLGSIDISDDTNLVGGTGITLTGDTLSTTDSEIVHDNLSGFVANEHIDHSTVSISAGSGLSGGGDLTSTRTLSIDSSVVTLSGIQTLANKSISGTANTISNVHIVDDTINTLTIARGGTGGTTASEARSNLNVDVAGTDNSTDVTLVTTSHDYLSLSGQAITLGTIDIGDDTNLVGGTGITLTGDTLSTTDSEIVHDNLSGFVSNEHIDHSTVSITAGTGLSGGGDITTSRTLTTDDSAIVHDNLSGFVANEHIDHSGVSITAGAGLTGGGDITATRDIAVGAGTGVTVNADDIAIGQDVATSADVEFNSVTADIIGDIRGATKFQAKADVALNKGDAVYISGVSGTTPTVNIADANDSAKMPSFGLAASSVSINASVEIITFGTLAGLNTSTFSVGDILYISTNGTSGNTLTNSAPTGETSLIQNIGIVQRSHASVGSIKVGGAGRTNATPNLDDGDIFIGNGSNQAVTASLNTKIEDYLDGGTSTANFDTISVDGAEITATPAELNVLDGITSTTAELNYTDGVTSNIQTQLDAKAPLASPAFTGTATGANLTLSGDLTVNGSTTTLDTTNLAVEDNLMELNAGVTSNANDSGFLIERGSTGDNAIFMWDESADKFTLGTTTATGTTTGDITLSSTGTLVANVEGNVTGAVTGNADTATTLATARNFSLTGDVTAGAVSFDGSGNVALSTTIAANSVALGTDTTGNYMSDLTEGTGIDITHTPAEGSNATIALDLTEVGFGGGANRLITDDGDGTVSTESGFTIDGTTLLIGDNKVLGIGNGTDLELKHDTNQNYIDLNLGNLTFRDELDNNVFRIKKDGGIALLEGDAQIPATSKLYLDGTAGQTYITESQNDVMDFYAGGVLMLRMEESGTDYVTAPDNIRLSVGTDKDSQWYYSGTNTIFSANNSPSLYITQYTTDGDIIFQSDNGSGGTTNYLQIDGGAENIYVYKDLRLAATKRLYLDGGGNTYIFEESADNVIHYVGGQNKLRFNSTGTILNDAGLALDFRVEGDTDANLFFVDGSTDRVGIGTATPQGKFQVRETSSSSAITSTNPAIVINNQSGSYTDGYYYSSIMFAKANSNGGTKGAAIAPVIQDSGNSAELSFSTIVNGGTLTEALRIDKNQNVGIGTTSPGAKLHIKTPSSANADLFVEATDFTPTLRMYSGGANVQSLIRFGTGSGSSKLRLQSITAGGGISGSVSDVMTLQENGNVGIGTTSPGYKLDVAGDARSDRLIFRTNSSAPTADAAVYRPADNTFAISTNNTERLRIKSDGKVGINGDTTDAFFRVNSTSSQNGFKLIGSAARAASRYALHIDDNDTNGRGSVKIDSASGTALDISCSLGYLGLQVSTPLDNVAKFESTDASASIVIQDSNSTDNYNRIEVVTNDMLFVTNNSERLRIDSQGNLKFADNGTNPSAAANTAFMFNDGGELKVLDELGNTTTISPHNFSLIPGGASEDRAWGYYSEKDIVDDEGNVTATQKVNVDMMKLARLVEELTGEKLVYTEED